MVSSNIGRLLIVPPIVFGVLVLVYQIKNKEGPQQSPPSERERHVRVIEVKNTDFVPKALGYGLVEPARVWNAVAQVSGRIEYVHPEFKKGAILKEGTEITRISPVDYRIAIKQAEANLRSAEAKFKELEAAGINAGNALQIEENALAIKRKEFERKENLLARGTLAQSSVDEERRKLLEQEQKVINHKNTLNLLPAQRAAQQEQIAVNRTKLKSAKLDLQRTHIRAPFNGRVSAMNVEVTQFVSAGEKLGSVDGMKRAEIDAKIPRTHLSRLAQSFSGTQPIGITRKTLSRVTGEFGLHAIVRLKSDIRDIEWAGEVVRISETIDPKTRTVGVIVAVDDHYSQAIPGKRPPLLKGMFVEVELRTKPVANKIVVPRSALHDGNLYVVNAKSRLEIRPVKASLIQGNQALIADGLSLGEKIVVSDLSPAIKGMLLKTTADKALMERLRLEASANGMAR